MMQGKYRDRVLDPHNRLLFDSGWTSNTIVDSAWPLIAGLLKNDPALDGILFWAVGAGDPAWDDTHRGASAATTRLQDEIDRQTIPAAAIDYLNEAGTPAAGPTTRLEIRSIFSWPEPRTVREFGLFGGEATAARNSGHLINYVIHPRLDLPAGSQLTRRLHFTLRPEVDPAWVGVPQHWLGGLEVTRLAGVGQAQAELLAGAGIETIAQLAASEPAQLDVDLPLRRRVEMCTRARLALRTVAGLAPLSGLLDHTAWQVTVTPMPPLAADAGASEEQVARLRNQVSALAAIMSQAFLQGVTIGELAQPL